MTDCAHKRFKLGNLTFKLDIKTKDNGKQYVVIVNTVTYYIIMQNLALIGLKMGIMRDVEVDEGGTCTKKQFDAAIMSGMLKGSIYIYLL